MTFLGLDPALNKTTPPPEAQGGGQPDAARGGTLGPNPGVQQTPTMEQLLEEARAALQLQAARIEHLERLMLKKRRRSARRT